MIRNYKYKLYVSKHTKDLARLVTSANFAWNHIVELSRRYYRMFHKSLSPGKLQHHMAKLAKRDRYWSKLHSQTMKWVCQKYTEALKQSFKQKHRGFPRCHKKHVGGSILFKGAGGYSLTTSGKHGVLVVNKLNRNWRFKFKVTRPWGDVRNVTVKRDNDGCLYIVICCNVPEQRLEREGTGSIGIDFGMKTFLTMSDGESVQIPDYHMRSLETTRMADRSYSKKLNAKVYGSSFKRAKKVRQKAHRKVADRRSDFHWKLAHELCRKNTFIAIEDLNLEGMKRHKRWGRKISSLGFGEFVRKLYVVADKYGTTVHKIGRFSASSQTCSECGHVHKGTKDLSVREWVCPVCGAVHDRDVNAARNILAFAQKEIKGEGVPLIGSGNETGGGSPPAQPCLEVTLHEPSENPMTSVVGVRQTYNEAVQKFGGQLPTKEQWEELKNNCQWTWTRADNGYKVTGQNGNSIFLPAAGYSDATGNEYYVEKYGNYWSSIPSGELYAWSLDFNPSWVGMSSEPRGLCRSVRLINSTVH